MTKELTEYQQEIVESTGKHLMVGSRQSGKTEVIVNRVIETLKGNFGSTVVIAPRRDNTDRISGLVRDRHRGGRHTKSVSKDNRRTVKYYSSQQVDYYDNISGRSNVLVDEANYISQSLLYKINKNFKGNIIMTSTPRPRKTFVEMWAEHAHDWELHHVPAGDVPFLKNEHLRSFSEKLDTEQTLLEVDAKYDL